MDTTLAFLSILAQNSGISGIGAGIGIGVACGVASGLSGGRKRVSSQLTAAIEAGDISVVDRNGERMDAEAIMKLLKEKHGKA